MIFDGGMQIYSTCRDCRQRMVVTTYGDTVHPTCEPKLRKVERLANEWLHAVLTDNIVTECSLADEIHKIDHATPHFKQAALMYASWGWPVFPLATGDKTPATRHGVKDATTDSETIEKWWRRCPVLNVGLATGFMFDVMDIDPERGGQWELLGLLRQRVKGRNVITAKHGVVTTRSGGLHLYSLPRHRKNGTNIHNLSGIDWRGEGGYVVAPPSVMASGGAWSWMIAPSPVIKVRQGDS